MKNVLKIFMILAAASLSAACEDDNGTSGGSIAEQGLVVSFDKSVIQASGNDVVTFNIYNDGQNVTDRKDVYLYQVTDNNEYTLMTSRSFSATHVGRYSFRAGYQTRKSEIVTVNAISRPVPPAPTDPDGSSTSFVHRAFFNQHTGSSCPNCPFMTHLLRKTLNDEVADKVVLASLRNYGGENGFAAVPNPSTWPYLHIDYNDSYPYNGSVEGLRDKINEIVAKPAKVGISANAVYYEDGQIIVKVAVKAAEDGIYNVGLWLMQDNYKSTQLVAEDRLHLLEGTWGESYHIHNNCVRVAESKYLGSHIGYPLGVIKRGQTAEWTFLFDVVLEGTSTIEGWWEYKTVNLDDLHFAAFVTTPIQTDRGEVYTVVNAVGFPYQGQKPFEYE